MLVVLGTDEHEMRRRPADLGARHHQREVLFFGVLTAQFQAVAHRGRKAHGIAAQAFVDAAFHFGAKVMHGGVLSSIRGARYRRLLTITLRWFSSHCLNSAIWEIDGRGPARWRSRQKQTDSEADEKSCLRPPKYPQECNA